MVVVKWIFIFWLFTFPFLNFPAGYEPPKIIWLLVGGVTLIVFWVYRIIGQEKNFPWEKSDFFFLAWLLVLTISGLSAGSWINGVLGGSYRHQGVLFFLTIWLVGKTIQILKPSVKTVLIRWLGWGLVFEGLVVLYQVISRHTYFGRPLGTLGEPNAIAGLLAFGPFFKKNF